MEWYLNNLFFLEGGGRVRGRECRLRSEKTLSIFKDFSPSKMADLTFVVVESFANIIRGFTTSKIGNLTEFLQIL